MPDPLIAAELTSPAELLGTIEASTSKTNNSTNTPFKNTVTNTLAGMLLMLQSDADCYVNFGTDNTVAATTSATGASVKVVAGERVTVLMGKNSSDVAYGYLACIAASGSANLKVWRLPQR